MTKIVASLLHPEHHREIAGDLPVFTEPWMTHLDPHLLLRYWRRKGCPGLLLRRVFGITLCRARFLDRMELEWITHPTWVESTQLTPRPPSNPKTGG